MRLLGHPVHSMIVHFPIALWPAHAGLHFFSRFLPEEGTCVVAFWLLVSGTILGWLAALFGAAGILDLEGPSGEAQRDQALRHGVVNGVVLTAFSGLALWEYRTYPVIAHGSSFLLLEVALLACLGWGNFLGGSIIWNAKSSKR